jgi:hypothetical protein
MSGSRPEEAVVLPVRIELTTSALPRMRSTTELRQHRLSGDAALWPRAAMRVKAGLPRTKRRD